MKIIRRLGLPERESKRVTNGLTYMDNSISSYASWRQAATKRTPFSKSEAPFCEIKYKSVPFVETEISFVNIDGGIIYKSRGNIGKMKTPITKTKAPLEIALSSRNNFQKIEAPFMKIKK